MAEHDSAATGAVFRSRTLRVYAEQAGFGRLDVAPIDSPMWRFYLLH
jgi:hypothetical protein